MSSLSVTGQGGLSLPEAIRRLTSDPADLFGIRDRGRLKPGLAADIAIFDPQTVGSLSRGERRYDLPDGGKRMVMSSRGIRYTIENGVTTYAIGELVGASEGKVLRS
ncbi:MAG: amidohydrolase family protein [Betaproteobacteria bacterium]|nr:amidohydrolase family protein [Betaproteobacteria bacterium]